MEDKTTTLPLLPNEILVIIAEHLDKKWAQEVCYLKESIDVLEHHTRQLCDRIHVLENSNRMLQMENERLANELDDYILNDYNDFDSTREKDNNNDQYVKIIKVPIQYMRS